MNSMFDLLDEDMKKAYLEGKLQFQQGKIVTENSEISILEMNKGEVVTSNFNRLFQTIKENEQNPKMRKGFSSIGLFIQGWDDVPDPIYEIMEIRRFYMKLYRKIPHFLFYVSPLGNIPHYILACLADIEVKARHGNFASPIELTRKQGHIKDVGSTTIEIQLPGEIGYHIIDSIKEHAERIQFEDEHEELPVIYKFIEQTIKKNDRLNKYMLF